MSSMFTNFPVFTTYPFTPSSGDRNSGTFSVARVYSSPVSWSTSMSIAASAPNMSDTRSITVLYTSSSCLSLFSFSAFRESMRRRGNIPRRHPATTPMSCPSLSHHRVTWRASWARESGGVVTPHFAAISSTKDPEKTPPASLTVFPSAAAAMVEKPKVTHSVVSIQSPHTIMSMLSRNPNPRKGRAAATATRYSWSWVGGVISAVFMASSFRRMVFRVASSRTLAISRATSGSSSMACDTSSSSSPRSVGSCGGPGEEEEEELGCVGGAGVVHQRAPHQAERVWALCLPRRRRTAWRDRAIMVPGPTRWRAGKETGRPTPGCTP
eukprot:Sspe_Gene.18375::Locus_6596_Transcript_1_1_Confidence_1.000_Length_2835::g.18375::m.18375